MPEDILNDARSKMSKAVQVVDHELGSLRTGRANIHMLDPVQVNMYGNMMPLNQLATISTPDAATIMIQPWDKGALGPIEKAILQANIGLTPNNDGKLIRLNVPPLTEDTRKEMVRRSHQIAEDGRIAIRNVRRQANEEVKKREKESLLTEDERVKALERVQKLTDQQIADVDQHLKRKEDEIMNV